MIQHHTPELGPSALINLVEEYLQAPGKMFSCKVRIAGMFTEVQRLSFVCSISQVGCPYPCGTYKTLELDWYLRKTSSFLHWKT